MERLGVHCKASTISVKSMIVPISSTNCLNPMNCNGNLLSAFYWSHSSQSKFEEIWTSSATIAQAWNGLINGVWATGSTGYYIIYPSNTLSNSNVFRFQRPALYR